MNKVIWNWICSTICSLWDRNLLVVLGTSNFGYCIGVVFGLGILVYYSLDRLNGKIYIDFSWTGPENIVGWTHPGWKTKHILKFYNHLICYL